MIFWRLMRELLYRNGDNESATTSTCAASSPSTHPPSALPLHTVLDIHNQVSFLLCYESGSSSHLLPDLLRALSAHYHGMAELQVLLAPEDPQIDFLQKEFGKSSIHLSGEIETNDLKHFDFIIHLDRIERSNPYTRPQTAWCHALFGQVNLQAQFPYLDYLHKPSDDGQQVRPRFDIDGLPIISSSMYFQYFPDALYAFGAYPEIDELLERFTRGYESNNGGDIVRLLFLLLNLGYGDREKVSGDFAEVGVYKGHTSAVLAHYAQKLQRRLWLYDTFSGFDQRDGAKVTGHENMFADTSAKSVLQRIGKTDHVRLIEGYFPQSVPEEAYRQTYAVVHLDCDLRDPIEAGLAFFYPRMHPGGMIIVHDYANPAWPGAHAAVNAFLQRHRVTYTMIPDKSGSLVLYKPYDSI